MKLIKGETEGLPLPREPTSTPPQAGRRWEASIPGRRNSTSKSRDKKEYGWRAMQSGAANVGSRQISENFLFGFEFENLSLGND